jgi:hypothetical protein
MNTPTIGKLRFMDTVVGYVSPFLLAAIVGLATWIDKIDDRQYENAQTYATKAELKDAIDSLKIEVDTRFKYSEQNQHTILSMLKEQK